MRHYEKARRRGPRLVIDAFVAALVCVPAGFAQDADRGRERRWEKIGPFF